MAASERRGRAWALSAAGLACCVFAALAAAADPDAGDDCAEPARRSSSRFCVVGAGPAGLQMGHLMHRAGLDYLIFGARPTRTPTAPTPTFDSRGDL